MERQYVGAVDDEERALLLRVARCKDEILRMTPGFLEDAAKARSRLKPFSPDVLLRRDRLPAKEARAAEKLLMHNTRVAQRFAAKWDLPYYPGLWVTDPSYLFEYPFSRSPWIEGTAAAVYEPVGRRPPIVFLEVDLRYPIATVMKVIRERLERGQEEWAAAGGVVWPKLRDEARKYENMLRAREWKSRKTNREIARELSISVRHVPALRQALKRVIATEGYRKIAPYLLPEFVEERTASYVGLPKYLSESVALANAKTPGKRRRRRGTQGDGK
ncbi:MAG: hypothetical protein ACT4PE_17105 [Candidatus Eiseniibacteriota bacterium]